MSVPAPPVTPIYMLQTIRQALGYFRPDMRGTPIEVLLLATALYESGGLTRVQVNGPARGLPQLQLNYIQDIASNRASEQWLVRFCQSVGAPAEPRKIYGRLTSNDVLAFGVDRLGFWCDPNPLPEVGDADAAGVYYDAVHQPGSWVPERWRDEAYPCALATLKAVP